MKKTNKPAVKKPASKRSATKKFLTKPKPRKAQSPAELLPILERLAESAERLARAAERLAESARPSSTTNEALGQTAESVADLTTPGEVIAGLAAPAVDVEVDDATGEE
jgi:hypothetical protein